MLARLVETFQSVNRVLVAYRNEEYIAKNLTQNEIVQIKELLIVLEPFFLVTERMSTEKYPSLSMVLPATYTLYKKVKRIKNFNFLNLLFVFFLTY